MDARKVLEHADKLFDENKVAEAGAYLAEMAKAAMDEKSYPAALSILNELTGYYRHDKRMEDAFRTAESMLEIIDLLDLWDTMDGATALLNIATVYKDAGSYSQAMNLYQCVEDIYFRHGVTDIRLLGLLNNMCVTSLQEKKKEPALTYANRALELLDELPEWERERNIVLHNVEAAKNL